MRQLHGVSTSFPRWARSGSVAARHRITNAYQPRVCFAARIGRSIGSWWRCTRWCAKLPKLPRRKETWRHRGYVRAPVCMSTRVRACVRARQWSRSAEENARLRRRSSARVTPAFSSFGSLPFFLRTLRSPFSPFFPFFPFSVPRDRCSNNNTDRLVTSARVPRDVLLRHAVFPRLSKYQQIREIPRVPRVPRVLGLCSNATPEVKSDRGAVDVLPGQEESGIAVPRVSCACLLSAANKVIVVAGKAPGGNRAILFPSSCMLYVSRGVWPHSTCT